MAASHFLCKFCIRLQHSTFFTADNVLVMKLPDFTPNFIYKRNPEENNLGFETRLTDDASCLLTPDDTFNVERHGQRGYFLLVFRSYIKPFRLSVV